MGDILQFPIKENPIRTREDAVDHLASELAKMLDEGDTLRVLPPDTVEMPADCPA